MVVVILIGAAYWYQEAYQGGAARFEEPYRAGTRPSPGAGAAGETVEAKPATEATARTKAAPGSAPEGAPGGTSRINGYDRLEGCRLIDHRDNDGDSFHLRHGDRDIELRLYFVDSPEKYLSDRYAEQRRRVAEQGRDLGGLSPEQTVELGQAAQRYTEQRLRAGPFTVYTKWEAVYDSGRVYGFVELPGGDGARLCEELVRNGLARIHTKGVATPEGRGRRDYEAHLGALERAAREAGRGAWGLN